LCTRYLLIFSTSSSESALPRLIAKMEHLGVDRSTVGVRQPLPRRAGELGGAAFGGQATQNKIFAITDRIGREDLTPQGFSAGRLNDGMRTIARMVLHTGSAVADLRETDFLEMRDEHRRAGRPLLVGTAPAWDILGSLGILTESRSFSAVLRRQGQGSTADLVDCYGLRCRPVRDILVRYLDGKRPAMDFSSFRSLVTCLM
jgi:hypothetical protein